MEQALEAYKSEVGLNAISRKYGIANATFLRHLRHRNKFANDDTRHFGRPTTFPNELEL